MEDLDKLILKALLVILTAPAWYPFLKAVWEEFNQAMAEDGGLFGRLPTPRELEQIEREKLGKPDPLVHEPWLTAEERMAGRRTMRSSADSASGNKGARAPRGPQRRGGF